jgi:hypothetical protein
MTLTVRHGDETVLAQLSAETDEATRRFFPGSQRKKGECHLVEIGLG